MGIFLGIVAVVLFAVIYLLVANGHSAAVRNDPKHWKNRQGGQ